MRIIASRFKYILTTDRVNRLHHGRHCADSSRVFWATQRYLEDSATRLVFHPQPTLRDLGTQYLRVKWFRELVSRGVLDEPAAQGQLPFYRSNWLPLLLFAVRWGLRRTLVHTVSQFFDLFEEVQVKRRAPRGPQINPMPVLGTIICGGST